MRRGTLAIGISGGLLLALAYADFLLNGPLHAAERAAAGASRPLAGPPWGLVLFAVTEAGDWWFTLPLFAAAAAWLARQGRSREAWTVVVVLAATEVASLLLKALVARPRPTDGLLAAAGMAFPSGHAARAAAVAVLAVALAPPRLRLAAAAAGAAWAALVGLSRLVFGVHHLLDVVGGLGLGLAVAGFLLTAEASSRPRPPGPGPS